MLMWFNSEIKNYAELNYKINKLYCDKNNIDLICSSEKNYNDRHPAWERLPLILKHISNYDYIIWVDADAFFYLDAKNIVDVIDSRYNFIFSEDHNVDNRSTINTGVLIIKNNQYSIDFISKWAYDENLYKNNPYDCWWDQGVLINMHNNNDLDIRNKSTILSYGILQHFYDHDKQNAFAYHLAGRSNEERFKKSKQYFKTINVFETISPWIIIKL